MTRWIAVLVALALGCEGGVAKTVTFKARGLYLSPSDLEKPDGALSQADNVVISRDGIVETRRGQNPVGSKALTRLWAYKGAIIGHDGTSTLSRSSDSGATWTDYSLPVAPASGVPLRAAEMAQNLYLTDVTATKRLDSLTGTPEPAGVPAALDVDLALSSAGSPTAMPTNSQLAYRVIFGKKDAAGRLLLGAPSGRAVITNTTGANRDVMVGTSLPPGIDSTYFVQGYRSTKSVDANTDPGDELGLIYEGPVPAVKTISQLVRSGGTTVTATATAHGYAVGQIVRVSPGGSVGGVFCAVGSSAACATSSDGTTWTGRTIPAGTYDAVAWNGTVFAAVGASVAATSPDGTTWTSRTIPAGTYTAVAWNGSVFAALGYGSTSAVVATSPDGITWTARSVPNISCYSVAWNGSVFAAVGAGGALTSPDGITWTARTMAAGNYYGIAWNGTVFVAVGQDTTTWGGATATSSDGITWTSRSNNAGVAWRSVAWNGTTFAVVGDSSAWSTSSDGTTWTNGNMPSPSTLHVAIAWNGTVFVALGTNEARTSPDGSAWTTRTIPAGAYAAIAVSGALFPAGEKTIATVPTADTFTYAEAGGNGTLVQSETATPLTAAFTDTVPDGFIGASLYTNANQEGILNGNERPPVAKDLAEYKGSLFLANVTTPAYGTAYLLAVGGTNGLASGDTVTVNGVVYTGGAAEALGTRTFKVYTSGSVSQNIRDTAGSLVRVVNRAAGGPAVTVTDISTPDDVPGQLAFEATDCSSSLTVTFSRTTAWSPATGIDADPTTYKNGFLSSKTDQPDSFPTSQVLLPTLIGSADKAILRVVATRSSLFFLKEDGVWRLTGNAGEWDVQPFDPTIRLVAPEAVALLDNTIWALTDQGLARIADTGTAVVSRPIESAILAALSPTMRATTALRAFAVGYESDRKLLLWLPETSTDTTATRAYVYDIFTQAWTSRTDDASHGLVNPADDLLYLSTGAAVTQERKTLTDADYQDAAAQAISTVVTWAPKFGGSPMDMAEFQEITLLWDRVKFTTATVGFATNLSQTPENVTLTGSDYGVNSSVGTDVRVVIWPPREKTWGSQLSVTVSHTEAGSPNALAGLAVTYTGQSGATSR